MIDVKGINKRDWHVWRQLPKIKMIRVRRDDPVRRDTRDGGSEDALVHHHHHHHAFVSFGLAIGEAGEGTDGLSSSESSQESSSSSSLPSTTTANPTAITTAPTSTRAQATETTAAARTETQQRHRTRMTTNPSHILIARGSRGHNPSAALSSPTETHAAASGIFRSVPQGHAHHSPRSHSHSRRSSHGNRDRDRHGGGAGGAGGAGGMSGQWVIEESEEGSEAESEEGSDAPFEVVELDSTFSREGRFPGTVKIVVEGVTFWAHREILVFASPFFEAALSGDWSETRVVDEASTFSGRRQSIASSVITIPQPPSNPRDRASKDVPTGIFCATSDPDTIPEDVDVDDLKNELEALDARVLSGDAEGKDWSEQEIEKDQETEKEQAQEQEMKDKVRDESLNQLEGKATPAPATVTVPQPSNPNIARVKKKKSGIPEAKIVLKEEKASVFHDFLKFVYPHLECSITWNNVEGLMNISSKLCVPALTKQCLSFLLTHAAGKPIKAMRIAELFEEEHLYRESSRFVLDNPGGWSEGELSTLSQETLLKLEKRRNWFLERVLKLGLVNVAREYQCCATCPDPPLCARVLDERWRQAYNACFRFGPCQPSMVYRYLRGLEGVTPPLALKELNCQNHAKAFTTTLFDRMFSLGVRGSGSGADPAPLGARVPGVQGPAAGPRRHFLYCSLNP